MSKLRLCRLCLLAQLSRDLVALRAIPAQFPLVGVPDRTTGGVLVMTSGTESHRLTPTLLGIIFPATSSALKYFVFHPIASTFLPLCILGSISVMSSQTIALHGQSQIDGFGQARH